MDVHALNVRMLFFLCLVTSCVSFLVPGHPTQNGTLAPPDKDAALSYLVQEVFDLRVLLQSQEREIQALKSQQALVDVNNQTGFQAVKTWLENLENSVQFLTTTQQNHEIRDEETNRTIFLELDQLNSELSELRSTTNKTIMKVYKELQSEITNLTVKEFGDVQRIEGLILTEHKATGIEIAVLKDRLQHLNDTLIGILKPTGIRLTGGDANSGRVEIRFLGDWGTVCDDDFGIEEARVVCRMLGKSTTNAQAFSGSNFGQGTGTIVYDDLGCTGSEPDLFKCPHAELGHHNCAHTEDAGVSCG